MVPQRLFACTIAAGICLGLTGQLLGVGPDVIIGAMSGDTSGSTSQPRSWGVAGEHAGYSVGHTECNLGDEPLDGYSSPANPTLHPVYHQALYRFNVVAGAGQIEMIGHSWLMHEFGFLQGTVCSTCTPVCGGQCDQLGVGCSSSHTAQRSGTRGVMGPKSQINAATGQILVWPYTQAPQDDVTTGRIRPLISDIEPTQNIGAKYYAEMQAVAQDDATAGNKNNNSSYRRCVIAGAANYTMTWASTATGQTIRETPALKAWADNETGVTFSDVDVPNDGRFMLGYKVTDLSGVGDGPWHYEYALYNMNSDRSAESFSVPTPSGVLPSNTGFHDVEYYKDGFNIGTAYDGTDWIATFTPNASLMWSLVPASPQENSNALRWGTTYNFRFDANSPPVPGHITLGLFKPGSPASVVIAAQVPSEIPCSCPGDVNKSLTIDGADIAPFTGMYTGQIALYNCADLAAPNGGPLDDADVTAFTDLLLNGSNLCQ